MAKSLLFEELLEILEAEIILNNNWLRGEDRTTVLRDLSVRAPEAASGHARLLDELGRAIREECDADPERFVSEVRRILPGDGNQSRRVVLLDSFAKSSDPPAAAPAIEALMVESGRRSELLSRLVSALREGGKLEEAARVAWERIRTGEWDWTDLDLVMKFPPASKPYSTPSLAKSMLTNGSILSVDVPGTKIGSGTVLSTSKRMAAELEGSVAWPVSPKLPERSRAVT